MSGGTPDGQGLSNAAALCAGGRVVGIYRKRFLPNYGVFDEQRWFVSSNETPTLFGVAGAWVGVSVCEDVWFPDGPVAQEGLAGADVVVNLNASPYNCGRHAERLAMLQRAGGRGGMRHRLRQPGRRSGRAGLRWRLAHRGGRRDAPGQRGPVRHRPGRGGHPHRRGAGRTAATKLPRVVATEPRPAQAADTGASAPLRPALRPLLSPEAEVYAALVLGTRDYLGKNGFSEAVIGLSGGIDSSLVATIAVDALGPAHVHGISMPSRYSSDGSRHDAEALAALLGIDLRVVPIEEAHVAFTAMLAGVLGREPTGLTDENLQSRLRGVLLMGVSNAKGWIVLTTGNKSEMATGYSTLYGDSAGGFAVIKDVPKTLVYDLCRYRNTQAVLEGLPRPIPDSVLDKAPSAELRPDQRDDQSLPPYEKLDPVLQGYVEGDQTAADLVGRGIRSGGGRAGRPAGGRGRVQAAADAAGRAHHDQGLRQGPAHADHQPLPATAARRTAPWLRGVAPLPPPAPRRRRCRHTFRSIGELARALRPLLLDGAPGFRGDRELGQPPRPGRRPRRAMPKSVSCSARCRRATGSSRRSGATGSRCGPASTPRHSSSPRPARPARRST